MLLHFPQALLNDRLCSRRSIVQVDVEASRCIRDRLQLLLIQVGFDKLPLVILQEFRSTVRPGDGYQRAGGGSHADGKDPKLALHILCRLHGVVLEFLAIREQYESPVGALSLAKRIGRLPDGRGDVRPAAWDGAGVQRIQGVLDGGVIDGQRCFHKRVAGESDQAHAVPGERVDQILRRELCPRDPVRL